MTIREQSTNAGIAPSAFEPLTDKDPGPQRGGRSWRPIPIITGVIFVAIMAFLFSAKSLEIKIVAVSESQIDISGGLYLPFGGRYLMRKGAYQVKVEAPGYHPMTSDILINAEDSQTYQNKTKYCFG